MSVRAYRVIKVEHEPTDTFNLWHDDKLVDFFDREYGFYETLNEGNGLTELPVEALQRAIKELELDPDVKQALQRDIEACQADSYVTYYCF